MGDYIPSAPVSDEARKRNGNLPGQGGVYNTVEQQDIEYQKGRDDNGNLIPGESPTTWARGGESYHNYGLAIDLEVYKNLDTSWAKDWDVEGSNWQTVINEAEKAGSTASGHNLIGKVPINVPFSVLPEKSFSPIH